jgi:hypothetical protein
MITENGPGFALFALQLLGSKQSQAACGAQSFDFQHR